MRSGTIPHSTPGLQNVPGTTTDDCIRITVPFLLRQARECSYIYKRSIFNARAGNGLCADAIEQGFEHPMTLPIVGKRVGGESLSWMEKIVPKIVQVCAKVRVTSLGAITRGKKQQRGMQCSCSSSCAFV